MTRYMLVAILGTLGVTTLLMMASPSGPHTETSRLAAVLLAILFAAQVMVWLIRWPTRQESQWMSAIGALCIAGGCLIESDPRTALLGCAAFAGLGGYVAFFHSVRLLVFVLVTGLATAVVCAVKIAAAGDVAMAVAKLLVLGAGMLAVPFAGQILVHWLSVDALKSSTDALTGLRNRRGFYRSARELIVDAAHNPAVTFTVVMIDLDHFKRVNDTRGHSTGDRILIEVANNLRHSCRGNSVVARVGGEEFLIAETTMGREPLQTAERLCTAVAANPWGVTASLGVASVVLSQTDAEPRALTERLVDAADKAMYEAKRAGGNQVRQVDRPFPVKGHTMARPTTDRLSSSRELPTERAC